MGWWTLETLKKWQAAATIFSLVAIPLLIAYFGTNAQTEAARAAVAKDYVALAVSILEKADKTTDPRLREWAVATVDRHATIKFSPELREGLEIGEVEIGEVVVTARAISWTEEMQRRWEAEQKRRAQEADQPEK